MKLKSITPSNAFSSLALGLKVYTIERKEVHAVSPSESYFLDVSFEVGAEYKHKHDSSVWTVMMVCPGVYSIANKKANRLYSRNCLSRDELQSILDYYFKPTF